MSDEGGEHVSGKRVGEGSMTGIIPTGADLTSEGSSVEVDSDVATEEEIPSTEEILRKGEETRRKGKGPLPYQVETVPHAPSGGMAGGAPEEAEEEEKPTVPHDKGRMEDIE